MNTMCFQIALFFVMACPSIVRAQSPPWLSEFFVNVIGELKLSACTPSLQGQLVPGQSNTANVVNLPDVYTNDLDQAGKKYGDVTLHFRAKGCASNVNNMWIYFTSANVDSNGRIIPNNSSSLRFEIRNNSASGNLVKVGSSGSSTGNTPNSTQGTAVSFSGENPLTNTNRVADKYYGIRYYAHADVPAGDYSATITANFKYY